MAKSARLRLVDIRALVQLVGECRDLGDDAYAWRAHLCKRLSQLVDGHMTNVGELAGGAGGLMLNVGAVAGGTLTEQEQADYFQILADFPDVRNSPFMDAYYSRPEGADGAALTRKDLIADRDWYSSAYFQGIHSALGLDHAMNTGTRIPNTREEIAAICISREAGPIRDFLPREVALVQEVQAALAPLIGGPLARFSDPSPSALPPRVRQVLHCLLEGDGDKQIAQRLGISSYTVNQYTKVIFRHFGVQGRTELMARWIRRGYPERFAWAN